MIKTCRNRVTAWVMMGLLVVGLNVWFALPAMATQIAYVLGGGTASGGFVLDDSLSTTPYVNWDITFGGHSFSFGTDVGQIDNSADGTGGFTLTTSNGVDTLFFNASNIDSSGGVYFAALPGNEAGGQENGQFTPAGNSVPEMSPGVLFMIGLLVLAGARWWTHRREGLQRG